MYWCRHRACYRPAYAAHTLSKVPHDMPPWTSAAASFRYSSGRPSAGPPSLLASKSKALEPYCALRPASARSCWQRAAGHPYLYTPPPHTHTHAPAGHRRWPCSHAPAPKASHRAQTPSCPPPAGPGGGGAGVPSGAARRAGLCSRRQGGFSRPVACTTTQRPLHGGVQQGRRRRRNTARPY